jgi:transcriptional regulator with XRE-family HTH domain
MKKPPISSHVGRLVKALRLNLGLTQEELARRAGLTRLSVVYLEGGRTRSIRVSTARRLSKALRVPPSELLEVMR